jgi:N-acetylmuramoyl-L-alanine amidase
LERGSLRFPEAFVAQVKNTFSRYVEENRSRFRIAAIIIDPGHGGRDPGATGLHTMHTIQGKTITLVEKDINLTVARQVHASLAAAFPDKRVLLTRDRDTTLSLEERSSFANSVPLAENEAAVFVSIHGNSSHNRDARGYEVWYLPPDYRRDVLDRSRFAGSEEVIPILNSMLEEEITTQSILLGKSILRRTEEAIGKSPPNPPNRGLLERDWFVVRNAKMPAVLVELLFLTNRDDAILLSDDAYLKKLSEAVYKGISYFIAFF